MAITTQIISLAEVKKMERECHIMHDFRHLNKRMTIYEIKRGCEYTAIIKEIGEIIKIATAQNCLSLILRYWAN